MKIILAIAIIFMSTGAIASTYEMTDESPQSIMECTAKLLHLDLGDTPLPIIIYATRAEIAVVHGRPADGLYFGPIIIARDSIRPVGQVLAAEMAHYLQDRFTPEKSTFRREEEMRFVVQKYDWCWPIK